MSTKTVKHPARFSPEIIEIIGHYMGLSQHVHDPFAGTGERLGALCDEYGVTFTGTEIECSFIVDPRVRCGDSTNTSSYPREFDTICCMAHGERILTSDLRWIDVSEVDVGQELLAFEEYPGTKVNGAKKRRHYEFSTVTHSEVGVKDCVEVTLSNGAVVTTTSDHPWLWRPYSYQGGEWVEAKDLLDGFDPHVAYAFPEWDQAYSFDAGWLSGMFDGEGWLGFGERHQQLAIAQAPGPLQERIERTLLEEIDAKINVWESKRDGRRPNMQTYVQGGLSEVFRVLGQLRPERLINDLQSKPWTGTVQPDWVRVLSVRHVGPQTVQSISTTSGTYIASGFLMHNTSPAYPNGMSDSWAAKDTSSRNTYRAAVKENEGQDRELARNNMGQYGYRGTGGRSKKRVEYWNIARSVASLWAPAGAGKVILNVSDFVVKDDIEPVVEPWIIMLEEMGWRVQAMEFVETRRNKKGSEASRNQRVDHEVVALLFQE